MTDILTRILIGGLGVFLMFLAVSILVVRAIAGSIRSMFAPRVTLIQNDSTYKREPGLVDTYKPMGHRFYLAHPLVGLLRPASLRTVAEVGLTSSWPPVERAPRNWPPPRRG
jgi:hypothetical protein